MIKIDRIIYIFICAVISIPAFFSGGNDHYCREIVFLSSGLLLFFVLLLNSKMVIDRTVKFILLGLWLLIFASAIFSDSLFVGISTAVSWLGGIVLFLLVYSQKWAQDKIERLFNIFLVFSTVVCLVGFYFYLVGDYSRLTSTFYWANPFASYLLFCLPVLFVWSITKSRYYFYIFIIQFAAFFLSDSRGAFISLAISLVILLFFYRQEIKNNINKTVILFSSIIVISGVMYFIQGANRAALVRTNPFGGDLDISSQIRLEYWRGAWDIFKDHTVWGSGPGSFALVYPAYQTDPVSSGKYPHNLYLEILSEMGVISLLVFILFLFIVFSRGIKSKQKNDMTLLLSSGIFGFILHNGVDVGWHYGANFFLFWIFAGIICTNISNEKNCSAEGKNKFVSFLPVFLILSLSWILIGEVGNKMKLNLVYYPKPEHLRSEIFDLAQKGRIDQGQEKALSLVKAEKNNSLNHELLGRIYLTKGDKLKAENSFKEAIRLDGNNHPRFYYFLAQTELALDKKIEAKRSLKTILDIYTQPIIDNRKLIILNNQNDPSTGIENEINIIKNLYNQIK